MFIAQSQTRIAKRISPICIHTKKEQYYVLKPSLVISHVNTELKPNFSEIFSASIIRVNVQNYHALLIHIPVCQIDASFYWQEGRHKLCGHTTNSNLSLCHLTWCPFCQLFCPLFRILFPVFVFLGFS